MSEEKTNAELRQQLISTIEKEQRLLTDMKRTMRVIDQKKAQVENLLVQLRNEYQKIIDLKGET